MSRPTDRPTANFPPEKNSGSGTKQNVFLTLICMSYWAPPGRDMVARVGFVRYVLQSGAEPNAIRRSPCLRYYPFVPECAWLVRRHRRSLARARIACISDIRVSFVMSASQDRIIGSSDRIHFIYLMMLWPTLSYRRADIGGSYRLHT